MLCCRIEGGRKLVEHTGLPQGFPCGCGQHLAPSMQKCKLSASSVCGDGSVVMEGLRADTQAQRHADILQLCVWRMVFLAQNKCKKHSSEVGFKAPHNLLSALQHKCRGGRCHAALQAHLVDGAPESVQGSPNQQSINSVNWRLPLRQG